MPTRTSRIRSIAALELRATLRGRMLLGFSGMFASLAVGIALAGLGGSGQVLVQGFARTSVSLLTLSLYLLSLLGVILGASAFAEEDGGAELLLAQPIGRGEVLLGRTLGLWISLASVSGAGFGAAGVLVAGGTGVAGLGGYLLVVAGATAVGLASIAVGVCIGLVARRRAAAVGWALAVWLVAAVLYDLAAIGVLQIVGNGEPGMLLLGILALNPIDGVRALGLVALGADVLLGPTGAALQRMVGGTLGAALVAGSLAVWLCAPLVLAARLYRARDF